MAPPFKQILLPTDFSENAQKALEFTLDLASRSNAKLILAHSIEDPYDFAPLKEDIKSRATRKVKLLLQDLKEQIAQNKEYQNLKVETLILNGRIVTSLLDEVYSNPAIELIVMGTKGTAGIKKILFGSNTSELVLHADVPVLAIPNSEDFLPVSNIVYTTNYQPDDLDSLREVVGWAELYDASVHVVHVTKGLDLEADIKFRGFRELCNEELNQPNLHFDLMVEENFHAGITTYLEQHPNSILAMTRYADELTSLFAKSHSRDFSCYTKVPLLVLIGD